MAELETKQINALDSYVSAVMKRVYLKMTAALAVTAAVAFYCANSVGFITFVASNSWALWGMMLLELALVISVSARINKMSSTTATILFYLYAIVTGATFGIVLLAYTEASIFKTFAITAGVFGIMSVYGYTTSSDLTKFGTYLVMALIALIVVSVVNMFLHSSTMEWIISFAGVAIFIGLTAWDTQKIKAMAEMTGSSEADKLATIGALSLYLDFINLFLYLLRFFGNSRE